MSQIIVATSANAMVLDDAQLDGIAGGMSLGGAIGLGLGIVAGAALTVVTGGLAAGPILAGVAAEVGTVSLDAAAAGNMVLGGMVGLGTGTGTVVQQAIG